MRACITLAFAIALASCSTLENIHDPQFLLLSRDEVPSLLKSIRCELTTFYAANAARKNMLDAIRNSYRLRGYHIIPIGLVRDYRYFDLDTDAYGAFVLEAKVVDSVGLPGTSSSVADVLSSSTGHSRTLTIGPNVGSQATYDMNYNFAIQQDNKLSDVAGEITEDELPKFAESFSETDNAFQCYRAVVRGRYDELAQGKYPTLERFHRITVNGALPLAAWLQENTTTMGVSRNILADVNPPKDKDGMPQKPVPVSLRYQNEAVDGGQMSYIFTVQYTGGVDVKFSLVSPKWNPLTADLSASMVQTGVLSLYVNGYMTQAALGAKSGVIGIIGRAGPPAPQRVLVVNGYPVKQDPNAKSPKDYPPVITAPGAEGPGGEATKKQALPPAPGGGPNRGQFLAPVTPFLLTPGP